MNSPLATQINSKRQFHLTSKAIPGALHYIKFPDIRAEERGLRSSEGLWTRPRYFEEGH